MRQTTFLFLAIFILSFISASVQAQGISMSPTRLFFTGKPGDIITQTVILSNSSSNDYVFNINTKDWEREEDGNKVYSEPGTLPLSNSSWVSTLESSLNLQAGEKKEVVLSMEIPENSSPTDVTNSMLFFTQIGKQKDEYEQNKSIGIIALFELGLHVYYTPIRNVNQSLEIINMEDHVDDASRTSSIRIKNDGDVVCDGTVELELTNKETGEEVKLSEINFSMMPNTEQVVSFKLPEGLEGMYLGVAIVKMAGSNNLRVGEKDFKF